MSNGINELRAAETALCDQEGTLRERLNVAANRFWSAQLDRGFWPEPLRDRADLLNCQLLFAGGIDATVRAMDENTVVIVAGHLWSSSSSLKRFSVATIRSTSAAAPPVRLALMRHCE